MPNESPAQRRDTRLREDRARAHEAAAALRHRINEGRYAGLRHPDELYVLAALVEACAFELDRLPPQTGRAALATVREILDDDPVKPGPVEPLTGL